MRKKIKKINDNIIYNHIVNFQFLYLTDTKKGSIRLSDVFELRPETDAVGQC
jgi:hypothetical protein